MTVFLPGVGRPTPTTRMPSCAPGVDAVGGHGRAASRGRAGDRAGELCRRDCSPSHRPDRRSTDPSTCSTAPDALTEVREAARACLDWARDGIAFREMAITYRQAEIYRPLIEAVFAEAGIPVYLDDGPSLAERPLGRRILALLDLIDSTAAPPRRHELPHGRLAAQGDARALRRRAAARWDSASRRAGIVAGPRPVALAAAPDARARGRRGRAARRTRVARPPSRRRREPARLRRGSRPSARSHCRNGHRGASLSRHCASCSVVYVHDCEDVLGYLDQLAQLDALVPEVEFERFLDLVRAEIRALKAGDLDEGQQGAFGRRGVNVLDTKPSAACASAPSACWA